MKPNGHVGLPQDAIHYCCSSGDCPLEEELVLGLIVFSLFQVHQVYNLLRNSKYINLAQV